jgi:hypothetical protein
MQMRTCYIISMPRGGLVIIESSNQSVTSVLGWRKLTVNTHTCDCGRRHDWCAMRFEQKERARGQWRDMDSPGVGRRGPAAAGCGQVRPQSSNKIIMFLVETLPNLRFLWSFHLFGHHTTWWVGPSCGVRRVWFRWEKFSIVFAPYLIILILRDISYIRGRFVFMPLFWTWMVILPLFFNFVILPLLFEIEERLCPYSMKCTWQC